MSPVEPVENVCTCMTYAGNCLYHHKPGESKYEVDVKIFLLLYCLDVKAAKEMQPVQDQTISLQHVFNSKQALLKTG